MVLGIPRKLLFGYVAIALFMAGDGFELTFLSKYLVDLGYTQVDAGLVFSVYGLVAAISAWSSGVLAEMFGARRAMLTGGILWIGLQVLFLTVGLGSGSLPLILVLYGARAVAYPLFIYAFVVLIAQSVQPAKLASAMGWYWAAYSIGIGVLGTYLPSVLIPLFGENGTLWLALPWVAAGVLICVLLVPRNVGAKARASALDSRAKLRELARGATILGENRQILLAAVVRVICNLTLFGFPVIMPLYLTGQSGDGQDWFDVTEWMRLWGVMFAVTIFTNVIWGRIGDRFGWMRQMRWYGCLGCAAATLAFLYVPQVLGANMGAMVAAAVVLGIAVSAFVPMGAIFPALAPEHRGAAVSAHNLAAGMSTFLGPAIATVLLPSVGVAGVCWAYAGLYVVGAVVTLFIHPPQPGIVERRRPLEVSVTAAPEPVLASR
ncbi:MFS transporter [Cellulomonas chitinilytica]|uniref:MFS transporter n=1 Tax=Cellulomonas chitinilytica TaxID=398759 RepID=A0A919U3V8_9CELL|nr:MFS transporter [Cellulomonas chitinilytica]GIG23676.1 MFS transporter [Cellulomonas chitinilytica]